VHASSVTIVLLATGCAGILDAQCTMHWQSPQVLQADDGRPAYVESPAAVPTQSGVLLLGVPAFLWAERDAFDPAPSVNGLDTSAYLTRLSANHSLIGFVLGPKRAAIPVKRPFAGSMRRLVAVLGADATTHVVWLGPPRGSKDPDEEGAVWYAERHNNQWTHPAIVFLADRFDWSGQNAVLLTRHRSDVHLVVPYYRGQSAGIAYIRRTNGRWTTTETSLRGLPSQTTGQFVGTDSLAVAFAGVGAPGARVSNGQHVYLIRAALSDKVWPSASLIAWSGLDAIRWLRMYEAPSTHGASQALTLVWDRIPRDGRSSADTIYAMVSNNAGLMWNPPEILPLPFKVATLTQDRDTMGNVHVVLTSLGGSSSQNEQIFHATLRQGHWTHLDSVPTGPIASVPTLSSIAPDTLLLVWGSARPADRRLPGVVAPVSKYATYVRSCPGIRP